MTGRSRALFWLAFALLGCKSESAPGGATTSTASPAVAASGTVPKKLTLVKAKPHVPVEVLMKEELERSQGTGQQVIVYVGASWCEPCRYFHDAAARGELDEAFPNLRVIEFDADADEARLTTAGCRSRMIPLFSRVTSEGKCDPDHRMMGSIKGPGAVDNITPRLRELLGGS